MKVHNPGALIENKIRRELLKSFLTEHSCKGTMLDLGCGPRPYFDIYSPYFEKTIGADLAESPFPKKNIDLFCSATEVPLPDGSVDFILCTEVLHDIEEPDLFFQEVKRLLRLGGMIFLTSPFMVPIVDGKYDHYRYTEHGLRYRIVKSGMEIIEITPVGDLFSTSITMMIKPVLRIFNSISKWIQWSGFYSIYNPLMYFPVVYPQHLYLLLRKIGIFKKIFRTFGYAPIGYVSTIRKTG